MKGAPRKMQSYQAYKTLYKKRVMPLVKKAYAEYVAGLEEGEPPIGEFKFGNAKLTEMLEDEPQEVKDAVERYRQGQRDEPPPAVEEEEQDGADNIADAGGEALKEARKAIAKQSK